MDVHQAAALVLGHLHVRRRARSRLSRFCVTPVSRASCARQIDRRAPPQLAEQVVPHAPRRRSRSTPGTSAHRGTRRPRRAPRCTTAHAVRADRRAAPRPAPPRPAVRPERARVHQPEARRGQRDEHAPDAPATESGTPLPPRRPGGDQVIGVLAVALGARRADRLAPVPARLAQHAVRLASPSTTPRQRPSSSHVSTCPRQPDRPRAIAGRSQLPSASRRSPDAAHTRPAPTPAHATVAAESATPLSAPPRARRT